ncbi:MAG: hypothetical protein JJT75_10205 [Opitutales bacterium]|nr:hypothetical protein [Opitutales bacterium]MCH8539626.1 hypothetical protein [Opitutales bacterium]
MKTCLFSSLLILLLFFSACSPTEDAETEGPFTDEDFPLGERYHPRGFALSYKPPEDWNLLLHLGIPGGLIAGPETEDITPGISVLRARTGPLSQSRFIRSFIEQKFLEFRQFREFSERPFTTDSDIEGVRLHIQSRSEVGPVRQFLYFFFRDGEAFVLTGSAPPSHAAFFGQYYDRVAKTFRWEEGDLAPLEEQETPILPEDQPLEP